MNVFRDVVVPVASGYLLLGGVVLYAARHPEPERRPSAPRGWSSRLRVIAVTVVGGYLVLLAIVLVFHTSIVGQRGALPSALRGGGFLALVCAGAFLAASALEWLVARR